jgi:hypothetical protein
MRRQQQHCFCWQQQQQNWHGMEAATCVLQCWPAMSVLGLRRSHLLLLL